MKSTYFAPSRAAILASLGLLVAAAAQSNTRLSREELIARRDAAKEQSLRLQPKESVEAQVHPSKSSILDRSVLLANGRHWTFIPKGAVLCAPEVHKERVNVSEGTGRYIPFTEFAAKNRGWLSTYSVTLEQARGNTPISEAVRKALNESGRVVISVCKGGAITTRAPRIPEATAQN
ncbi:MAG: hypothetical protein ACSHYB_00925 [Roseibacillus sp.]